WQRSRMRMQTAKDYCCCCCCCCCRRVLSLPLRLLLPDAGSRQPLQQLLVRGWGTLLPLPLPLLLLLAKVDLGQLLQPPEESEKETATLKWRVGEKAWFLHLRLLTSHKKRARKGEE